MVDGYASFPLKHCSDYILTSEMLRSLIPDLVPDDTDNNLENDDSGSTEGSENMEETDSTENSGNGAEAGSTEDSGNGAEVAMDKPNNTENPEPAEKEEPENTVPGKSPRTGDSSREGMLFMLFVLLVSGVLVWGRETPGKRFFRQPRHGAERH